MTIPFWLKNFQLAFSENINEETQPQIKGKKVSIFSRIFRCWHGRLSRPFVEGKLAYRSCVKCGARRPYDPKTLRCYGSFYYPAANLENLD